MSAHPLHAPVLDWYAVHARDLPWRRPDRTPWGVLVSEVMLQQTPVARVLPVWTQWLVRWPRPADLAAAAPGEAIRHWGRLGYPRRALRLHAAATAVVERHGGEVPADHAELLALPGVGGYTAAAVASFAFGGRHAVVDTNVRRVQGRAVTGSATPGPALTRAQVRLAEDLVPDDPAEAAAWAVASMELGALVCTARAPRCPQCPVAALCRWRLDGAPPPTGPQGRGQAWIGTDRRVRGMLLAQLRSTAHPVPRDRLLSAVPDAALRDATADPDQRDRCLAALVEDGLVEPVGADLFALPR
jgi:A/G-specific adenine glycosylase